MNPRDCEKSLQQTVERELIARSLAGDHQQFAALVRMHQNRVYRFVRKYVRHHEQAEDLTQEAFLQAYLNLARFREDSRFSTWLIGIAYNLTLNYLNRSRELSTDGEKPDEQAAPEDDPAAAHIRTTALERLEQAIGRLSEELRDCLILVALEELDYPQAAAALGVPVGTVKSRLSRARAQLRQSLGYELLRGLAQIDGTAA